VPEMLSSLFKVTAWEKASPARRLVFAFGRVTLLFAVLLAIGYFMFAHHYAIEAKVWHWRHGNSTTIDGYKIPVPVHWLVLTQKYDYLTMANTSPNLPRDGHKIYTAPVITANVGWLSARASGDTGWMSTWASRQRKRLADNRVESVVDKTLNFANESVRCIGGNELDTLLRDRPNLPRTGVVSLDCVSDRGLQVMFVGEPSDVESFYVVLSQIRPRS
jgi:hypothetical protein